MEKLKNLKERLVQCVESEVYGDMSKVDTEELGDAVDMIKDLSEAMYYCSIVKAMEEKEGEKVEEIRYYPMYYPDYRMMDKNSYGRMYYEDRWDTPYYRERMGYEGNSSSGQGSSSRDYPMEIRDYREGRSPISRRNYMESKEMHHDKAVQMKELEKYLKELSEDVTEMISDATPEEKTLLQQKLTTLAAKVK